jgi:transcriptional regulator with XRE-family HTH domain
MQQIENAVRTVSRASKRPLAGSDPRQIGERLRHLRADRKLTILELAAKAGVSAGIISQIERGNSNPSMKTLQRLRTALGVNLWEFLDPNSGVASDDTPFVRRADQRPRIVASRTGLVKELLSPRNDDNLRFMIITMAPGSISEDVLIGTGHKGGLVLSGSVVLTVGDSTTELGAGDSFQFKSNVAHGIANRSAEEATLIWIMSVLDTHL